MADINSYLILGKTDIDIATIDNIDIEDGWVTIVADTQTSVFAITDISMNSNKNGTWRFCICGDPVKVFYIEAMKYVHISRKLPFVIPADCQYSLQFKADVDGASATGCISGFMV